MRPLFILLVALSLTACAIGPDYKRPVIDTPQSWRIEEKAAGDLANTVWWEQFDDPVLNDLIATSLKENTDLKIAAARVEEYVGRYWVGRSPLFPQIYGTGDAGRQRMTERGATPVPSSTVDNPSTLYQGAFSGSWEIDIWGRLRRLKEAARADLLGTEEGRRSVVLTLVTSVANRYVNLRDLDKQLEVAERTAKSREVSYKLFKLRFEGGLISELELSQVKSEYELALSRVPSIQKQIGFQENALSILLGMNPGPIPRGRTIDALTLPSVPAGLPSDLLERRPDIRQAEQDLIAANARIGAAKALYFPTISLTGLFGWSSTDLSMLFSGPSQTWYWAGTFTAPIFTGGAVTGNYMAAQAVQQQALFRYQKAIQTAFREVNDALIDQNRTREQLSLQKQQVDTLRDYARIARLRYDEGYTSYIEVLDAERSLFDAELSYTGTQGVLFQSLVNLYEAMGGGWVTEAEKLTVKEGP
ncbi:MAG: Outer membrane protein OprM precursor [Syntrophorhabdus sp. PtaU1.Bin002]|nr:MAG: Outer membrane protein OprM precursor [Syntrophorhabdus sp. PtaU1.Bin002]